MSLEEKMKRDVLDLHSFHSQHRLEIVNLLQEESSYIKSVTNEIEVNMRQICVNGEPDSLSVPREMVLQENDVRDVHISPDAASDTNTKVYVHLLPNLMLTQLNDI